MSRIAFIFICCFSSLSIIAQSTYLTWTPLQINQLVDSSDFKSAFFKSVDSVITSVKDGRNSFISLCSFSLSENDKWIHLSEDHPSEIFYPAICEAVLSGDTLEIKTGVGFFAGIGVNIQIANGKFHGVVQVEGDQELIFKNSLNEPVPQSRLKIVPLVQSLKVNGNPQIRSGEIFIAEYESDHAKYYQEIDKVFIEKKIKLKIIFKFQILSMKDFVEGFKSKRD